MSWLPSQSVAAPSLPSETGQLLGILQIAPGEKTGVFRLQRKGDRELAHAGRGNSAQAHLDRGESVKLDHRAGLQGARTGALFRFHPHGQTVHAQGRRALSQCYRLTVDVQLDLGLSGEQLAKSIHRRTRHRAGLESDDLVIELDASSFNGRLRPRFRDDCIDVIAAGIGFQPLGRLVRWKLQSSGQQFLATFGQYLQACLRGQFVLVRKQ